MENDLRPLCYLRTHRMTWGLTIKELASLIGYKRTKHLSRIERSKRGPRLEVALACQVIFGETPAQLFPHVYSLVEERIMRNICELHSAMEQSTSPAALRKLELCKEAMARATRKPPALAGV